MSNDTFEDQVPTLAELAALCEYYSDHTLYDLALYADLLEQADQPENAIEAYRKAIVLCDSTAVDDRFHHDLLVSLAQLLTDDRQFDEARQRLLKAVEIADRRGGDGMRRYSTYNAWAAFHSATGDEAEAARCNAIAHKGSQAAAARAVEKWRLKSNSVHQTPVTNSTPNTLLGTFDNAYVAEFNAGEDSSGKSSEYVQNVRHSVILESVAHGGAMPEDLSDGQQTSNSRNTGIGQPKYGESVTLHNDPARSDIHPWYRRVAIFSLLSGVAVFLTTIPSLFLGGKSRPPMSLTATVINQLSRGGTDKLVDQQRNGEIVVQSASPFRIDVGNPPAARLTIIRLDQDGKVSLHEQHSSQPVGPEVLDARESRTYFLTVTNAKFLDLSDSILKRSSADEIRDFILNAVQMISGPIAYTEILVKAGETP